MKKLALLLALLLAPLCLHAQTVVSGTVLDPNGLAYAGGTLTITQNGFLVPSGATLTSAGKFALNLTAGSGYTFTVQFAGIAPPLGTGPQTCTASSVTVTGSTQTVSFTCPTLATSSGGTPAAQIAPNTGIFTISNNCSGQTNCLAWTDDDSTDNCGTATTTFLTAVNAYAGPGVPQVYIGGSGVGKAYKLATAGCELQFTKTSGVAVHLNATLDCAQASQGCIVLGPNNTSGGAVAFPSTDGQDYTIDGGGAIIGGTNLTGTGGNGSGIGAGIYVMPQVINFHITGIKFFGSGANKGFGSVVSTLGNNCSVWSVYIDYPVADGVVSRVYDAVNTSSSTAGGCGLGVPLGSSLGNDTIIFTDNTVGTSGSPTGCGSIGIYDGGSYGQMKGNVIFGFAADVLLAGVGHDISGNELEAQGCLPASGSGAAILYGASGSSAAVGPMTISNNRAQVVGSGHTFNFIAVAGNSTATLAEATIINNQNVIANGTTASGNLFPVATNCAVNTTTATACVIAGNIGFVTQNPTGTTSTGWYNGLNEAGIVNPTGLGANLTSTLLINAPVTRTYFIFCEVVETTADAASSTLPSCQVNYTDALSAHAATVTITATNTGNTVGTIMGGSVPITVAAAGAINMTTTGYASGTAGAMKYQVAAFALTY